MRDYPTQYSSEGCPKYVYIMRYPQNATQEIVGFILIPNKYIFEILYIF